MNPWLRRYLLAPAVPALVVFPMLPATPAAVADPLLMVVLVAVGAVAANYPVMVSARYKVDPTPAVYLACVMLFPPAPAVAMIGLSRAIGDITLCLRRNPATGRRRRSPRDVVFNTSQLAIAAAPAALAYQTVASAGGPYAPVAGAAIAAAVMYMISTTLVVVAAGLMTGRSPFDIWVEAAAVDLRQTVALYVAGYLLAVLSSGHTLLALAMMVPVAGIQLAIKRTVMLREQTIAAVESMADVVDRRDPYTFQHSQSVAGNSVQIARRLRLPDNEVELIRLAARVHDLGKIAVPDKVLHKAGRLTDAEFALMKKHPETGGEILAKFSQYRRGRELVLAHHERLDGRGYPRGLSGASIPLGARIIAVADSWDAMTSDRPYRAALNQHVAMGELLRGRGTQWDPAVVDAFAETLPDAVPAAHDRSWLERGRPLVRSLGAAVGILAS